MKLQGKTAVITGGNSGIGYSIAKEYQDQGANVVIFGRNADTLAQAQKELGDDALVIKGDVTNLDDLKNLFADAEKKFGKIDIVVANAGIAKVAPLEHLDEASFDLVSDINFKGAYFTVQSALNHLADNASIVITGSAVSYKAMPNMAAYAATKAAVRSLVRTFSAELAPRGIRVNVLSPGAIETPIWGTLDLPAEQVDAMAAEIASGVPLGRIGKGREMANVAVFLGSDDSSYVTGSDFVADGGFSA
ncbi:MAG: SDR family oxidoreductase [Planctomycetota bacterium]|jgi:NAD(P)-dependent dehydrogenase (short-subunit alcohol dehydrogenase family)